MEDRGGHWEELKVTGDQLVATVKKLVHEGNVRRIILKTESGETFLEIPLTVGVVGAMLLPLWAALGAVAALVSGMTIVVERVEPTEKGDEQTGDAT
jgi:hypothetical protein